MKPVSIKSMGIKAERTTSLIRMARGLMFSKKKNILFEFNREQDVGIHMLFVFFPIIAVWIDEKKRIKEIKVMKPFISFHEEKAKYVLEIPYDRKILMRIGKSKRLRF